MKTPGCQKRQPKSSNTNRLPRGRRCVPLGKMQDHHHRRNVKHERRLSVQLVGKLTQSTDKERYETRWETLTSKTTPKLHSENHIRKSTRGGPFVRECIPSFIREPKVSRTSCHRKSPLRKKALGKIPPKSGFRCTRQPSNKKGWYQAASKVTKDDLQFTLSLLRSRP